MVCPAPGTPPRSVTEPRARRVISDLLVVLADGDAVRGATARLALVQLSSPGFLAHAARARKVLTSAARVNIA